MVSFTKMCKNQSIFVLTLLIGLLKSAETNRQLVHDARSENEIFALIDFETDKIYYKDEQLEACFVDNFDTNNKELLLIMPTLQTEPVQNISSLANQFCGNFPVYALNTQNRNFDTRNKRSAGQWYPRGAGASQSQVQGQVSGQGFFSGQAQSQISGGSQTQVQLSGDGILGSVSSSAGNAQAQISLGETTGSGQAGTLGLGPSKSQVQVNLGQNGRGSMASAGVLADEAFAHSSDDGQNAGLGIGGGGVYDHRSGTGGRPSSSSFSNYGGYQERPYRDDPIFSPGNGVGGQYQPASSYNTRGNVGGQQQPSNGGYNSYPVGYRDPLTTSSNGGRIRTTGSNNAYHPPTSSQQFPANLPQLPDIQSGGFPSFTPVTTHSDTGNGYHSSRGINFDDLRTHDRVPTTHTNGIGISRDSSTSYRQPTVTRRYPSASSSTNYQQGRNGGGSNGGSGHPLASSYGTGHAIQQTQAQSQMVHLGRGTTEFYRPQQNGGNGRGSDDYSSFPSYPQTAYTPQGRRDYGQDTSSFTSNAQYPSSTRSDHGNNGRATTTNGLSSGTGYIQPSSSTGHQTYPSGESAFPLSPITSQLSQNTTRATIRDGYIPTDDGYVRPYLNGVPRQQAGINNGNYPTRTATFSTHSPSILLPTPTSVPATYAAPISTSQFGQPSLVDHQHTQQQYPSSTILGNNNINGHYPTTYSQQPTSQGYYNPTAYERPNTNTNNGGGSTKKCAVVTFTCTILIESNGRAKICRPNGNGNHAHQGSTTNGGGINYGSGQIDHGRQICCC